MAEKASKASVDYGPGEKDGDHCGVCRHFEPPKSCDVVAGEVTAMGWCKKFSRSRRRTLYGHGSSHRA